MAGARGRGTQGTRGSGGCWRASLIRPAGGVRRGHPCAAPSSHSFSAVSEMGLLKITCSPSSPLRREGPVAEGCRCGRGHQGAGTGRRESQSRWCKQPGSAEGGLLLPAGGVRWGGGRWREMPGLDPVMWPQIPNWVSRAGRHPQVFACTPVPPGHHTWNERTQPQENGPRHCPVIHARLLTPTSSVPRLDPKGWRKLRTGILGAREVLLPGHQCQQGSVCRPGHFLHGHLLLLLQDRHATSPESPNLGRTGRGRGNVPEPCSGLTLT